MKASKILSVAIAVAACGQGHAAAIDSARADSVLLADSVARALQDSINRAEPGYIVDSILPVEEQIRRFRTTAGPAPAKLRGAADSREALVANFMHSLEARDTLALVRLTIDRAEFAYLVYPDSPFAVEPLQQAPDIVWMRHTTGSAVGLTRLLERLSGRPLGYESMTCDRMPDVEGRNRIWKSCVIRYSPSGVGTQSMTLFAGILEREGRFKILSYANGF